MKELIVALVAAVFGLAGTVVGAALTARAAKKGAVLSAQATLQQVHDQATVDQSHWLRQQRLQAYEGFLAAWDECLRLIDTVGLPGDSEASEINPLKEAAGRMTERARRIDILGPAEVAQAAEELADSIRRDVTIATKLKKLTEAKLPSAAERMTNETAPAMAAAREAVQETRRQMRDLVGETNESGRPLHEDPRTAELFANFERAQEVADAAIARAHEDGDRISAFLDQATVIVDELKRNQEARAYTRERFTTAARHTLASANPPTS
ncbi:hypothetical protein HEP86_22670 [Streptomyces sp. RPA4-5]|uniref:hypothetical protein n=1 Tax=Streptomyces sp. RPA4-5 TaxID=2721245 RepID=UPI00143E9AD0|nr:hypothetical protein [Streptomyces sp. RPA4-5]QIY56817.1 hypothetical protein HEP86_22670 [Streptomyces sp. RPA4-5]